MRSVVVSKFAGASLICVFEKDIFKDAGKPAPISKIPTHRFRPDGCHKKGISDCALKISGNESKNQRQSIYDGVKTNV
jgi:hypothetical protein